MIDDDINNYVPSLLNPRTVLKHGDLSLTQNSIVSRSSLSLKKNNGTKIIPKQVACKNLTKNNLNVNKENYRNSQNISLPSISPKQCMPTKLVPKQIEHKDRSSTICKDYLDGKDSWADALDFDFLSPNCVDTVKVPVRPPITESVPENNVSLISLSSATELGENADGNSDSTVILQYTKPTVSVSFGVNLCNAIDVSSHASLIKRISVTHKNDDCEVQCEVAEGSNLGTISELDENMNDTPSSSPLKRSAVAVNLEIKKKKLTDVGEDNSKILILNTNAIKKISHVIVQPPNYKIVKGKTKFKDINPRNNGSGDGLTQKAIDSFFPKCSSVLNSIRVSERLVSDGVKDVSRDAVEMSKNSGVSDARNERIRISPQRVVRKENDSSNTSGRGPSRKGSPSPRRDVNASSFSPQERNRSACSQSTRRNMESIHFSLPPKSVSSKKSTLTKSIPHHKIVAGTHFAVDAFSYGDIPNVKHYFLTHFHSDHYTGLKKSFNKLLFCSKITAELCTSRLGVSPKVVHTLAVDETIRIDGVEVTALEANHCPGALMLVFSLPSGKSMLHTGDFRASPLMESYPIFWNKDIHTIYLDTTYCNPRYDFPTQEQSLEMAVYILRQKKLALESAGKKFSSVLIVCGTYTIGKEKFFLGVSRRVGCSVWACPEKERVLEVAEGRSSGSGPRAPPHACQLHVVPMRDLTHEKLKSYLESMKGAFSEVVAFKPSGWENGKAASDTRDTVTIHGIPYSEHSSFSELVRFVNYLKPKQVVPTVDISGGVRAVQKYFPCPLVYKDELSCQSKLTDFFSIQTQQQVPAVT